MDAIILIIIIIVVVVVIIIIHVPRGFRQHLFLRRENVGLLDHYAVCVFVCVCVCVFVCGCVYVFVFVCVGGLVCVCVCVCGFVCVFVCGFVCGFVCVCVLISPSLSLHRFSRNWSLCCRQRLPQNHTFYFTEIININMVDVRNCEVGAPLS